MTFEALQISIRKTQLNTRDEYKSRELTLKLLTQKVLFCLRNFELSCALRYIHHKNEDFPIKTYKEEESC